MGPDHHLYPPHGPHGDGFGLWWLWPVVPTLFLVLLLLTIWALRDFGVAWLATGGRGRLAAGPRARWRAASARHRQIAAAFAAYECDPQAVLHRPALADVRQPATARFVETFAEACALATDNYPGRAMADAFVVAVDRAAHAWAAAAAAAERLRTAQFAPGERTLLEQTASLLSLARQTPHDGERLAAYDRAAQHLAELKRRCGWVLPQQAAAVLSSESRRALRPAGQPQNAVLRRDIGVA
jgi:hypothetical protein